MKPKKCALVSTPRSGTHYLRMTLDNHPKIGWAGEFFRPDSQYRNSPLHKEHFEIKDYVYDNVSTPFVDNLHYVGFVWHLTLESDLALSKVDEFILLKRRNILEHLCSLLIATKTGKWRDAKSKEKIELNMGQLNFFIDRQNKAYKDFENLGVRYKTVFYEDLCENFSQTIKSVQDYLGLEYFDIFPARLKKQETRSVEDIISNYEEVKWTLKDMNLL